MVKLVHNVQKKQHRERSQVSSRAKYGLLEKKKDYKLRADNYHKKQAQLKILKEKVKYANKDEYYHAMNNKRTQDGMLLNEHKDMSHGEIALFKAQDVKYLNLLTTKEGKKIDKYLKGNLVKGRGNHTLFVDNEKKLKKFNPVSHFNTTEELLAKRENRLTKDQLLDESTVIEEELSIKDRILKKKLELEEMKDRMDREKQLINVRDKLALQRELMKGGSKKKIVKDGKTVYKWKNQRKR
ncbi:rRNA-processing protein [Martiniozyma asiatica (nom. inval.)]|nr:rRNA-processing protein [Martiniozyma asiatica]